MKYLPQSSALQKHIDHYWIVREANAVFQKTPPIYAYPGITPEVLIVLEGSFDYQYEGEYHRVDNNNLFSFINEEVILDPANLVSFIIVQFKPRALSSLIPFVKQKSGDLMSLPVCDAQEVFGLGFIQLVEHLKHLDTSEIVSELDDFFYKNLEENRAGFISEMAGELKGETNLKEIMALTKYSYSTLERHFKKDTGLSPKQFQSLQRYKAAVQEIYGTRNEDWMHYVVKYGYFDQSHFIKDIKRFTTFTPAQLLKTPGLISFRPENL